MNVRFTLFLAALALVASSSPVFAQDTSEMDAPERASNSAPWPTFHRALNGEVASTSEGSGGFAPERASNSAPWPTFHRALNGEVVPAIADKEATRGASLRRLRTA